MVHALENIHRLLKQAGHLIDIHPFAEAPLIEIHQGGKIVFAEPLPAYDIEDIQHAERALTHVIQRGLFSVERVTEFTSRTYASSVAELRDFLVEQSAFKDEDEATGKWEKERAEFALRVEAAMRAFGEGAEVAFYERVRLSRLAPERSGRQ
ncbi:MAG: hypothetical protein PVH03_11535 [Chloroflexota bacterium]|jgi:hypothetical protein